MTTLSVVVRVLFAADKRWPTAVKRLSFDDGVLTVTCQAEIGTITITFVEEDENYHIRDVSLIPKEKEP